MTVVKKRVNQMIDQAKNSLKILESLEKETLAKAKSFVKIPIPSDPKKLTSDTYIASLRKMGLATQSELDALRLRIEQLEARLAVESDQHTESLPQ